MRMHINRLPIREKAWGGGAQFINAVHDYVSQDGVAELIDVRNIERCDSMLLVGLDAQGPQEIGIGDALAYKTHVNPDCKVVVRVNENDARKGTNHVDGVWLNASRYVDGTVFVSEWLRDYFVSRGWECRDNVVILNGVDRDVYRPGHKRNNGKLNIVAHHWSDNRLKGADVYEWLDRFVGNNSDRFTFTYVGRHKCSFNNATVVQPLYGAALGTELSKYDLYVSASRFDPGPNHVIESIACGLPTYVHVDGGGAVEFAGRDHVFSSVADLERLLNSATFEANVDKFASWPETVRSYVQYVQALYQRPDSR